MVTNKTEATEQTDPFYSESNMIELQKSIQEVKEGKVVIKTMEELEAMAEEE